MQEVLRQLCEGSRAVGSYPASTPPVWRVRRLAAGGMPGMLRQRQAPARGLPQKEPHQHSQDSRCALGRRAVQTHTCTASALQAPKGAKGTALAAALAGPYAGGRSKAKSPTLHAFDRSVCLAGSPVGLGQPTLGFCCTPELHCPLSCLDPHARANSAHTCTPGPHPPFHIPTPTVRTPAQSPSGRPWSAPLGGDTSV